MDAKISTGIQEMLDDSLLVDFLKVVKRGKRLHPGPYTKDEWSSDVAEEISEVNRERCHWTSCDQCKFFQNKDECLKGIRKYRGELIDLAVVCYRTIQELDKKISEMENAE